MTQKPLAFIIIACTTFVCVAHAACPSTQSRFSPNPINTAEIIDTKTNLVWARCSVGQLWSGSVCTGSAASMTHAGALSYAAGQNGWRLPNVKELANLADKGCSSPAIDATVFPYTVASYYWTSSPFVADSNSAWIVDFSNGFLRSFGRIYGDINNYYPTLRVGVYVRLVRG